MQQGLPPQQGLDQAQIFWACVLVCLVGTVAIAAVVGLALYLYRSKIRSSWVESSLKHEILEFLKESNVRANIPRYFAASYVEFLQRLNDFWGAYLQVLVALVLIILLTLLLLTKTITAEAGLPILSAISGFAIAKGVSGTRNIAAPPDHEPGQPNGDKSKDGKGGNTDGQTKPT